MKKTKSENPFFPKKWLKEFAKKFQKYISKSRSKLVSDNGLENLLPNKRTSTSFPQPKKVKCFQCQTNFFIKFVIPQQNYSQKNNWKYWTKKDQDKKICNSCLKKLYYDKLVYWKTITDLRKRNLLRKYIYDGTIS